MKRISRKNESDYISWFHNDCSSSLQCHWVLHRIGEVMLRSVKTGRPLYHALHCWAMVGPTLLKVSEALRNLNIYHCCVAS